MSKSSRWLIVTICPSSLKAKVTISLAGILRVLASSLTVMNSVTRTSVFSRSFSSRRFCSSRSRKLGPSSRRCTPRLPTGPLIEARVREMFCATASWSTSDFFPFLRFFPFSRRRQRFAGLHGLPLGFERRLHLSLRFGGRHLGRGAAAPLGPRLGHRRHRLHHLGGAPPLRGCRRLLLLALVPLPPRPHQGHLLRPQRRQVTAHEDVHLLEHADELLAGDAEFRRQVMNPRRCHSTSRRRHEPAREPCIRHPDRLHRRPAQPRSQALGGRSPHHRHPTRPRQPLHLFPGPQARVRSEHHAGQRAPLQPGPHAQAQEAVHRVRHSGAGAGGGATGAVAPASPAAGSAGASSSPPSSVISLRNAISFSASSGVIPAILSTSSRSNSRMSWRVRCPACSSTFTSSAGSPFSSRSATLVAASSSGGSGANSGPSPPRSSHSRLEYRSIFHPVSSDARRTFCPLRPMASDSWSSSTMAWTVFESGSENTRATRAGASASLAKRSGSGDQGTISIRSPPSSFTTACTREPFKPTHAPTGSMASSREATAILVRLPASRAVARISTTPCWISGTSSLKSAFTNSGSARDRMRRGPLGVSSIRFSTARIVSPWWKCSRWFCSR